jgi:lauroyl/myristoyl acyltransferase
MKLSILHLIYQTSALCWASKNLSPETLFAMCRRLVGLSVRFNPHTQRYLTPIRSVLEPHMDGDRLRRTIEMHLVYRRYLDNLPFVWREWSQKEKGWFYVEGERHLGDALSVGKGAILVSSHNYGVNRLIPPILAKLGYPIGRVGAWDQQDMIKHWGDESVRAWKHLHVGPDGWARLRATKQIARVLGENSLVYMSMPNRLTGAPEQEVRVFSQKFFIDSAMMRLFDHLRVAVLPCFAICDDRGKIKISIHPPLNGSVREMSESYCRLFSHYLREHPEFCRFWKPLMQRKDQW